MSKRANPPPPGDRPKPSAPPPPPAWRNWLWPILILAITGLFFLLPTRSPSTSITYSKFLSDVSAHQVKTVELASTQGGTSSGTLANGTSFTVVIPPQAGQQLLTELHQNNVQVSSAPSGQGFGTEVLIYLITFGLPIVLFIWLFRRLSRGAAGGCKVRWGWAGPGPGYSTRSGRRPRSPTWRAMRAPRPRSPRWWTSCGSRTGTPGPGRWCRAGC